MFVLAYFFCRRRKKGFRRLPFFRLNDSSKFYIKSSICLTRCNPSIIITSVINNKCYVRLLCLQKNK